MTIDEAIRILELDKGCNFEGDSDDLEAALQLGIEALKCVKEIRHHPFPDTVLQLPGEKPGL